MTETAETPAEKTRRRMRRPRTALGWFLAAMVALVLLVAGVGLVARYSVLSPQGLLFLEARTDGLKLGRVGKLKIEGLTGDIWHDFHIRRLTIADEGGVWIEAKEVAVVWHAAPLLRRRMHAESIAAQQVTVFRRPILTPKTKSRGLPVSFDIDSLKARVETQAPFSVQRGLFDLAANFRIERRGGGEGRVDVASLLHQGDGLKAEFMYGEGRPFRVIADAVEAQGGALAGSLGLSPDLPFNLVTRIAGDPKAGKVEAVVRTGDKTPLDVKGAWNGQSGEGTARVNIGASRLLDSITRRIGPEVDLHIAARPSPTKGLHDTQIDLKADNLTLAASGPVDFVKRAIPKGLGVEARVMDVSRMAPHPKMGAGHFIGRLTGKPSDIALSGRASVDDLSLAGYSLANAQGPVTVRYAKKELTVTADATGRGGRGAGVAAALIGGAPRAKITLSRLADRRILIRSLDATGSGLKVKATGSRTILGGLRFGGDLTVSNLAAARPGASGVLTAKWSAARGGFGKPWAFTADARGAKFATGMAELDRLLGASPRLQAKAAYNGEAWAFSQARLDGAAGDASAAGTFGPDGALKFTLDWNARGPFAAGPVEIAGNIKGGGALTGTLDAPRADLNAAIDGVDIGRLKVNDARIALTFARSPDGSSGAVRVTGASNYGPALAAASFRFADGGVDLSNIDANAAGVVAKGALALREGQPSRADLTLTLLPGAFLTAGRADGRVVVVDGAGGPTATMRLTGADLRWRTGETVIRSIELSAAGPLARLPYTLKTEARMGERPISLDGRGVASNAAQGYAVTFEGQGKVMTTELKTITPLTVAFGGPDLSARGALAVGGGRADIDARQRDGAINVRAVLADVDLSALSQDMAGKIDATLTASGRGGDLAGDLEAALQDARSRDGPRDAAIDGTFKAALRGNRLSIDAAAANDKGLKSTASFVLPVEASATPFRIAINRRQAMQGRFDIDGELQPIWDLFFGGDRTLGGRLVAQGTVTGSLGDPRLNGQASLSNGKFEDFATGLKLRNVSINAALNTDAVTVSQFTAQDSNGGSLKGDGRVSLERGGASNFSLTATNFLLIDNDMATARASGEVTVTRDAAGKALLAGRLTVDRADVVADPPTPSGVVPMEVVEVNVPAGREKLLAPATRRGPSVALDVTLTAPRRVFVRGRGLDVELSLRAHVGGTTSSPVLDGTARVVRGDFNFASKRFEFDESGVIYLATSAERIRLDLQATREDPSLTAVIKVEGTAAKPQITLTSTPVLPNDEVLSQVLFGRSASQLSPLEAAQLASALSSLATGGGFDVIGSLRSFAGLDRLAFGGGGDQGGFSVSGGKYITDDVYLELTGGGREGTSAQVEWRVRRNLSIISRLGGDGDTRLSVRWRKDSRRSSSGALVTPR